MANTYGHLRGDRWKAEEVVAETEETPPERTVRALTEIAQVLANTF